MSVSHWVERNKDNLARWSSSNFCLRSFIVRKNYRVEGWSEILTIHTVVDDMIEIEIASHITTIFWCSIAPICWVWKKLLECISIYLNGFYLSFWYYTLYGYLFRCCLIWICFWLCYIIEFLVRKKKIISLCRSCYWCYSSWIFYCDITTIKNFSLSIESFIEDSILRRWKWDICKRKSCR